MSAPHKIQRAKAAAESDLLARKGVTGVGIGQKIKGGKRTGELVIRVYVEKKKPKSKLAKTELIPETIEGIKTDVIERKFVLHPGVAVKVDDLKIMADTGTYDPLTGGISLGPCRAIGGYVYVGTLGCIVVDNDTDAAMMLSNFHVMCVDDGWSVGDTMAQPGRPDTGSCPADAVGTLQRASLGGKVDCAAAKITARGHNCSIEDIGPIEGTATAVLDEPVRKRGRTTGLSHGFVDDLSLSVTIDYGDGLGDVTLTNQIGIEVDSSQSAEFGNHGDSGSVVVNANREVVGLYFAGSDDGSYGVANPIDAVLTALNVRLCTPQVVGPIPKDPWTERITVIDWDKLPWADTSPWRDIIATGPWADYGGTPFKALDDVKTSFYDTVLETTQEHAPTLQEHGTLQETPIPYDPRDPVTGQPMQPGTPGMPRQPGWPGAAPFALATPHHAPAATAYEQAGAADLDAEIERATAYVEELKKRQRRGRG